MKKRVAVFAHWDVDNIIDDYVVYYLRSLQQVSDIVFVSDCDLSMEELGKIDEYIIGKIVEKHGEYDFGSYKRGILFLGENLKRFDELILCNDSCYGPFLPFENVFNIMESKQVDYWGGYSYYSPKVNRSHIQSYFLVMKKNVFCSESFLGFIKDIKRESEKYKIIREYEIGLSKLLDSKGFRKAAICPESSENETVKNEAFGLVKKYNFPFLKKGFVIHNPKAAPFLYDELMDFISNSGVDYPFELMFKNIQRTAPDNYKNGWFHPKLIRKKIISRSIVELKEVRGKYLSFMYIKIFRVFFLVLPFRILTKRLAYELSKGNRVF